jgi:RNA polymerase sigma-70 factor (ECF subfamily)
MSKPTGVEAGPDDRVLIARWQAGDERAAALLVERHAPALARFAVRLGMDEDVDEVVQDTFVRAFGALDTFRADSALRTWLFTIERRLVIDRRRRRGRRGLEVVIDESHVGTGFDALDAMVADESQRRMAVAIQALTRMQREVFTLRVTEGMAYSDIAQLVGSTEGACRVHYHNAVRSVRGFLHDA